MSTVLFPAGLKVDFRDVTTEEVEFYTKAWNLEYNEPHCSVL